MNFFDYFSLSWKYLKNKPLRTFLTVLGVSISLILITTLLTLGSSLKASVTDQFNSISPNTVIITPKSSNFLQSATMKGLKKDDCRILKESPDVLLCSYMILNYGKVEKGKESTIVALAITNNEFYKNINKFGYKYTGKIPEKGKALLGYSYSTDKVFKKALNIGDKIKINGKTFKVSGFMQETGNPKDDSNIYLNEDDYNNIDKVNIIEILVKDINRVDQIKNEFERHKNQEYEFLTADTLLEQSQDILNIINYAILAIAMISLVVGSIGISNTLFTAISERTRDIGIMKAIGAKNSDIFNLILIETGIIMFFGFILGESIGLGFAKIGVMAMIKMGYSIPFIIKKTDILITLGFALLFGVISAIAPAKSAMKLNPIDAMRK